MSGFPGDSGIPKKSFAVGRSDSIIIKRARNQSEADGGRGERMYE
jgi:hypothetical protein